MFDVLVATDDADDGELLAHGDVEALAAAAGLWTPPVLGRGRLGELDRIAIAAPTEVPVQLGLPPIAANLREGFVAKPDRRLPYGARPIVKRKLPDFDDARFDAGAAWDPGHLGVAELVTWAQRLVNPARIASARSKVGTDRAAIVDEIVLDVAVDLETVFAAAWRDLGAAGEAEVLTAVRVAADAIQLASTVSAGLRRPVRSSGPRWARQPSSLLAWWAYAIGQVAAHGFGALNVRRISSTVYSSSGVPGLPIRG